MARTTRNYWDVPLPLEELWEAVRWSVKPEGAVLLFAQCPYDKVLGASNLAIEHDLSYIQNPKPHSKGRFLHYGQWLGAGRQPSFQARLRAAIVAALEQRPADFDGFLQA